MSKLILRERAIKLRKEGFSYNFIKKQVNVSKSTLTRWLSGIEFSPNNDFIRRVNRTHTDLTDLRKKIKYESEQEARELAKEDVGQLTGRDLFMLGLGIYMGEGTKTVCLRIVNSDPAIIKTCITWIKRMYGVQNHQIMLRIHLYPDCNVEESINYWMSVTGLPKSQFYPSYVDKRQNKKAGVGKLLFGTAHVTIRSGGKREFGVLLRRRILNSIEIAKSQAGLV